MSRFMERNNTMVSRQTLNTLTEGYYQMELTNIYATETEAGSYLKTTWAYKDTAIKSSHKDAAADYALNALESQGLFIAWVLGEDNTVVPEAHTPQTYWVHVKKSNGYTDIDPIYASKIPSAEPGTVTAVNGNIRKARA